MQHDAGTPADPPYWMATPSKPKLKLPAGACDAHVHVWGPRKRFPFAEGRRYTPSDAPKELLFKLHERLGIQHCVIVQPACHGPDNSVTIDAVAATGGSYKGVALVPVTIADAELKRLDPLTHQREREFAYFNSGEFLRVLAEHGVELAVPAGDGV